MWRCLAVVLLLASPSCAEAKPAPPIAAVVETAQGALQGSCVGGSCVFKGIPYAEPPVSDLRWRPPVHPPEAWNGTRDATEWGANCPQLTLTGVVAGEESCLFVNVFAPEACFGGGGSGSKCAVMFWIHGGAYTAGGTAPPIGAQFNGSNFNALADDVVVVTANYRLGILGFAGAEALRARDTAGGGSTGNYGIQDQRAALRWAQANIGAFGGDAGNVMIFGESAGSGSVANHLVHEQSWPLFDKAGMESGPFADWSSQPLDMASTRAEALATRVGCDPAAGSAVLAACLRGANESAIEAAAHGLPDSDLLCDWSPVIDGVELTDEPQRLAAAGKLKRGVPTLLGTNHDEGTEFVSFPLNGTQRDFDAYAAANVKGYGSQVVGAYPLSDYPKTTYASPGWWAASGVMGDSQMSCPARRTARWIEAAGGTPYLYFLTHKLVLADAVELKTKKPLGVFHGTDLGFVFKFKPLLSATEEALADVIIGYWTSFAVDGVPSSPGQVAWPAYAAATDQNLNLNLVPSIQTGLKSDLCAFWDTVTQNKTARGV